MKKLTCPKSINNKKGFTLIELLVVIAILAILSVIVAIAINPAGKIKQSKDVKIKSDLGQIGGALQAYFTGENGAGYPTQGTLKTKLVNGYLGVLPYDPDNGSYTSGSLTSWRYKYYTNTDTANSPANAEAMIYGQGYEDPSLYICWDSNSGSIREAAVPSAANIALARCQ